MAGWIRDLLPRLRRYLGINVVVVVRRALAGEAPSRAPAGVACRALSEALVVAFSTDPQLELSEPWIRDAYARGSDCLGAFAGGQLVGYTWVAFGDTPYEDGVWIRLDERLRYTCKSFVRPEWRGRRIIQALHAAADRPELRRGRHFTVAFVNADNHASLAALARAGSRPVGFIAYLKGFGGVLALRSPGVKRAGITLYKPSVDLDAGLLEESGIALELLPRRLP